MRGKRMWASLGRETENGNMKPCGSNVDGEATDEIFWRYGTLRKAEGGQGFA
jgi:hypothetical protein